MWAVSEIACCRRVCLACADLVPFLCRRFGQRKRLLTRQSDAGESPEITAAQSPNDAMPEYAG